MYSSHRRTKQEVLRDILQGIKEEEVMTRVMYYANVSWRIFCENLDRCIKTGLIEKRQLATRQSRIKPKFHLSLTPKGEQHLRNLDLLLKELES
jgi:predicted transcriptional regulator